MIRYFACALLVALATLPAVTAIADTPVTVRVAMLESHGPQTLSGEPVFSAHDGGNFPSDPRQYRSPSVINGPSYFSALRRYDRQHLTMPQRLQGYGFGTGWSAKPH
ncbi:hypothetical protein [Paraburkholderia dilworthii]|uniref:hypothetical protein n=1 Tax=Paraburkholderia dilworthii TaxID=948106 RepID=UPI0012682099|nr:hypothetical protein [Paraburkholderia dilworthii]